jgi:HTH-type transcriptional regulator/antitoxin MqsA
MASRSCGTCGDKNSMARFANERFTVEHADRHRTVDGLFGWRCNACGEVTLDPGSALSYAAAGDALVLQQNSREVSL